MVLDKRKKVLYYKIKIKLHIYRLGDIMEEKCIVNPERDCLGLIRAQQLEKDIQENRRSIEKIDDKIAKHDQQITVLETLVSNLKELPSALNNLEKTMALMGQNLEILNGKVDTVLQKAGQNEKKNKEQDEAISKIDHKSKVDIMDFVRDNWWKICLGLAASMLLLDKVFKT